MLTQQIVCQLHDLLGMPLQLQQACLQSMPRCIKAAGVDKASQPFVMMSPPHWTRAPKHAPTGALKAYNKAIEIKREAAASSGSANGGAHLPARLLNNAAVLHLRAGNSQAAYDLMAQAVHTAGDAGLGNLSPLAQVRVALSFPLGRSWLHYLRRNF